MAKNWKIEEDTLTRAYEGDVTPLVVKPSLLFEDFEEMESVQKACVINGLKQKLDDSIARSKDMKLTEVEKREVQEALWLRISTEREWNMAKTTGPRGPAVSYKLIVPNLQAAGLNAEAIAKTLSTTVERITPFLDVPEVKKEDWLEKNLTGDMLGDLEKLQEEEEKKEV